MSDVLNRRYMVQTLLLERLESFLNELEQFTDGQYEIVSIFPKRSVGDRSILVVVIAFYITLDWEWDENEIKRKLGITE